MAGSVIVCGARRFRALSSFLRAKHVSENNGRIPRALISAELCWRASSSSAAAAGLLLPRLIGSLGSLGGRCREP